MTIRQGGTVSQDVNIYIHKYIQIHNYREMQRFGIFTKRKKRVTLMSEPERGSAGNKAQLTDTSTSNLDRLEDIFPIVTLSFCLFP